MNNIFNLNRMGLLIQRYFVENLRRELFYWGMIILTFMFFRNNLEVLGVLIFVFGAIYASRFFKEIHSKTNGTNYLMISASQLEKIIIGILFCIVYFFGMMIISYIAGNLIGTFLNNLLAKIPFLFTHNSLEWVLFEPYVKDEVVAIGDFPIWNLFEGFVICQSIFLFGGLYFKNNPLPKTVGCLFLFFLSIVVLAFLEAWISNGFRFDNFNINENSFDGVVRYLFHAVQNIFMYLLAPFFWVASYFRLTEKEV